MIYSLLLDDKRALVSDDISKVLNLPFKHADSLSITQLLMQLMRLAFETIASNNMFVIPVPFHKSLYVSQRYNQASELARKLSDCRGYCVDYQPIFLARHGNACSMGGLNTKKRKKNVGGAICLRTDEISSLAGKEVLLIYDVMTTGATLKSCAWLLLKRGRATFASTFVLSRLFKG